MHVWIEKDDNEIIYLRRYSPVELYVQTSFLCWHSTLKSEHHSGTSSWNSRLLFKQKYKSTNLANNFQLINTNFADKWQLVHVLLILIKTLVDRTRKYNTGVDHIIISRWSDGVGNIVRSVPPPLFVESVRRRPAVAIIIEQYYIFCINYYFVLNIHHSIGTSVQPLQRLELPSATRLSIASDYCSR